MCGKMPRNLCLNDWNCLKHEIVGGSMIINLSIKFSQPNNTSSLFLVNNQQEKKNDSPN